MTQKKEKGKGGGKETDLEGYLQLIVDGEGKNHFFSGTVIGKMPTLCKGPNETPCWDTHAHASRSGPAGKRKAANGVGGG